MARLIRDRDIIIKFQPKVQKIIGLSRTGLQGAQGPVGPQGIPGPRGPTGFTDFPEDTVIPDWAGLFNSIVED